MDIQIEKTYEANGVRGVVFTVNGTRCSTFLGKGWINVTPTALTIKTQVKAAVRSHKITAPYGLSFGDENVTRGGRHVRNAEPTEKFWKVWRQDKAALKSAGYSVSKFRGEWQVAFWSDETVTSMPKPVTLARPKPAPRRTYSQRRTGDKVVTVPENAPGANQYLDDEVEIGGELYTVARISRFQITADTPSVMGSRFLGYEGQTGLRVQLNKVQQQAA